MDNNAKQARVMNIIAHTNNLIKEKDSLILKTEKDSFSFRKLKVQKSHLEMINVTININLTKSDCFDIDTYIERELEALEQYITQYVSDKANTDIDVFKLLLEQHKETHGLLMWLKFN